MFCTTSKRSEFLTGGENPRGFCPFVPVIVATIVAIARANCRHLMWGRQFASAEGARSARVKIVDLVEVAIFTLIVRDLREVAF